MRRAGFPVRANASARRDRKSCKVGASPARSAVVRVKSLNFGVELYDLCRGIDDRPVEPDRPRKSLSTEETFPIDLTTLEQCEERLEELFQELMADLAQKESTRAITKIFVKLKFNDFTRTTAERAGIEPTLQDFRSLLAEAFARAGKPVRLIGLGVRFAETTPESAQIPLL
jgi:DNA polymerase-4